MLPAGFAPADSDRPEGASCAGVYTTATRQEVVDLFAALRFSGWVGPAEGRWVLVVAENPLGAVAARRRTIADLARETAARTGAVALGAQVRRDESLGLWLFHADHEVTAVDTAPLDPDDLDPQALALDEFGEPVLAAFGEPAGAQMFGADDDELLHAPLARTVGRPEAAEDLTELLEEELSEDESESERLTALARLLGLPTWLVAAASLPRDVPSGPARDEVLRLQAGRTGAAGWLPGYLTRRTTRRPPRTPHR